MDRRFHFEDEQEPRIALIGAGGPGVRVAASLAGDLPAGARILAVDSDPVELEAGALSGLDLAVLVADLGDAAGARLAASLARLAAREGAIVLAAVSLPRAGTGDPARDAALEGLRSLEACAAVTAPVGADPALDREVVPALVGEVAREWLGFLSPGRRTQSLDLCDLRFALGPEALAAVGAPAVSGPDRARRAAEAALASPLVRLPARADGLVVVAHCGTDCRLDELRELVAAFDHLCPADEPIYLSVDPAPAMDGWIRVSFFLRPAALPV